jgi:hypothetical protein
LNYPPTLFVLGIFRIGCLAIFTRGWLQEIFLISLLE